jgi:hypothetical protein
MTQRADRRSRWQTEAGESTSLLNRELAQIRSSGRIARCVVTESRVETAHASRCVSQRRSRFANAFGFGAIVKIEPNSESELRSNMERGTSLFLEIANGLNSTTTGAISGAGPTAPPKASSRASAGAVTGPAADESNSAGHARHHSTSDEDDGQVSHLPALRVMTRNGNLVPTAKNWVS